MFGQVDASALEKMWPEIATKPFTQFETRIDEEIYPFQDETLLNFLMWLRLFSNKRISMKTLLSNFIIFSDVRSLHIFKHFFLFAKSMWFF